MFWGQETLLSFPELVARQSETGPDLPLSDQALLLYYFATANGSPLAQRWVSFSELPDGRFYNQAFKGYTGRELARTYGENLQALSLAARRLGAGLPGGAPVGDRSFLFRPLPRVPLLLVFWQGDEEFPSSFQILFDASASHYLPTAVCAVLGSMLARRLISMQQAS